MTLNEQQRKELIDAAKPLMKWLSDNCHPHCAVLVDQSDAVLCEQIARVITDEFIKD